MSVAVGIETFGGVFTALIPAGTRAPAVHTEIFTTAADNQSSVEIHLLGGNAPMASENRTLGKFSVVGIREARRGVPQIEVAVAVDASGVLHVSAKDLESGKQQEITLVASAPMPTELDVEEQRRRRDAVRKQFGVLFDRASAILFEVDPMGINFGDNLDEYDAEVGTILPRLSECASSLCAQGVVHEEFVAWFGAETAGSADRYEIAAERLWRAWREHHEGPAAR